MTDALLNLRINSFPDPTRLSPESTIDLSMGNDLEEQRESHFSLNGLTEEPDNEIIICDSDLTVKGVMISEFSTSEKLKYLQRSKENVQKDFLKIESSDFGINI